MIVRTTLLVFVAAVITRTSISAQQTPSEQCQSETAALASDPDLQAALEESLAPLQGGVQDFCTIDLMDGVDCSFDFLDFPSDLEQVCVDAGGQYAENDRTLDCSVTTQAGITITQDFRLSNIPQCIGQSCSPDATITDGLVNQEIENSLPECDVQNDTSNAATVRYLAAWSWAAPTIIGSYIIMLSGILS